MHDPTQLPPNLPVPFDDGACRHLLGAPLPDLDLPSTSGDSINFRTLSPHAPSSPKPTGSQPVGARPPQAFVLFFYPRTGIPGQPPSLGFQGEDWDSIPGARGCTPHSCAFRDLHADFARLGITIFGVSTNALDHQREFKSRMHIPFDFLSDADLRLTRAMRLPTFEFPIESGGPTTMLHRAAWYIEPIADDAPASESCTALPTNPTPPSSAPLRIRKLWYPVFPPNENAPNVLKWLHRRGVIRCRPATPADAPFIRDELTRHWGGPHIWSIGRRFDADRLSALIAEVDAQPVGLATYDLNPGAYQCEVVTLSSRRENEGVATRLLEEIAWLAKRAGAERLFLTTSNDNLRALAFYQKRGWRLRAIHPGMIDLARRHKPDLPAFAPNGIPIRDEIELEVWI